MKRAIIIPDPHMDLKPPKAYKVVKNFMKSFKTDFIILLGDFMNCTSLSHWIADKPRKLEKRRYMKEVDVCRKELDYIAKHTKDIIYCEGNHEFFIELYLDKHPEMEGDLELETRLELIERNIVWVRLNGLYCVGDVAKLYFTHGIYTNKYHAQKHLTTFGCNLVYGHSHSPQVALMNMRMIEPYMAWGLGWLGDMEEMKYLRNRPVNWIHQFAILEMEKRLFTLTPINIIDGKFIYNGKKYKS